MKLVRAQIGNINVKDLETRREIYAARVREIDKILGRKGSHDIYLSDLRRTELMIVATIAHETTWSKRFHKIKDTSRVVGFHKNYIMEEMEQIFRRSFSVNTLNVYQSTL